MNKATVAIIFWLSAALAGVAAADESGWFLERPSVTASSELGADLLAPRYAFFEHPLLSLSGGYRFGDSFFLQATLREVVVDTERVLRCSDTDFICAEGHRLDDHASNYSLSLVPAILLHDDLALYGRLGIQGLNLEASGEPAVRKSDLLFGIGVGYDISNPLRLQLEYRSMDLDIKLTSIGFSWRF